jgi:hypothetical protein
MKNTIVLGISVLCIILTQCESDAATCPETKVVNRTEEWNDTDQRSLESAQKRCKVHYEDSPCLKVFEKREENVYRATCGAPQPD